MSSRQIEPTRSRPPILRRAVASVVLVAVAALAVVFVIHAILAVFWVVAIVVAIGAILWALNTIL